MLRADRIYTYIALFPKINAAWQELKPLAMNLIFRWYLWSNKSFFENKNTYEIQFNAFANPVATISCVCVCVQAKNVVI